MMKIGSKKLNMLDACTRREQGLSDREKVSKVLLLAAEDHLVTKTYHELICDMPEVPKSTFLMVFSPDGSKIASTHGNHNIYVTDLRTGKNINKLVGHPRTPWCIAFHPSSNQILATGCLGGQVRIWDLSGGSEVWSTECHSVIASLAFHPSDRLLVIATYNELYFWDWSQPKPFMQTCTNNVREKIRYVAFDRLGHKLITGIANQLQNRSNRVPLITQPSPPRVTHPVPNFCHNRRSNRYQFTTPAIQIFSSSLNQTFSNSLDERHIAVCYHNLRQQYQSLLKKVAELHRRRCANTTDRGTDPMEPSQASTTSTPKAETKPTASIVQPISSATQDSNVCSIPPQKPVPSVSSWGSPQPGPSGLATKRTKRPRSKKEVIRIRSSDSCSSSDSSDDIPASVKRRIGVGSLYTNLASSDETRNIDLSTPQKSSKEDNAVNSEAAGKSSAFSISDKSAFHPTSTQSLKQKPSDSTNAEIENVNEDTQLENSAPIESVNNSSSSSTSSESPNIIQSLFSAVEAERINSQVNDSSIETVLISPNLSPASSNSSDLTIIPETPPANENPPTNSNDLTPSDVQFRLHVNRLPDPITRNSTTYIPEMISSTANNNESQQSGINRNSSARRLHEPFMERWPRISYATRNSYEILPRLEFLLEDLQVIRQLSSDTRSGSNIERSRSPFFVRHNVDGPQSFENNNENSPMDLSSGHVHRLFERESVDPTVDHNYMATNNSRTINSNTTLPQRPLPPSDIRYLRYGWMHQTDTRQFIDRSRSEVRQIQFIRCLCEELLSLVINSSNDTNNNPTTSESVNQSTQPVSVSNNTNSGITENPSISDSAHNATNTLDENLSSVSNNFTNLTNTTQQFQQESTANNEESEIQNILQNNPENVTQELNEPSNSFISQMTQTSTNTNVFEQDSSDSNTSSIEPINLQTTQTEIISETPETRIEASANPNINENAESDNLPSISTNFTDNIQPESSSSNSLPGSSQHTRGVCGPKLIYGAKHRRPLIPSQRPFSRVSYLFSNRRLRQHPVHSVRRACLPHHRLLCMNSNPRSDSTTSTSTSTSRPDSILEDTPVTNESVMNLIDRVEDLIRQQYNHPQVRFHRDYLDLNSNYVSESDIDTRLQLCRSRLVSLGCRPESGPGYTICITINGWNGDNVFSRFRARQALSIMLIMLTNNFHEQDMTPALCDRIVLLLELALVLVDSLLINVLESVRVTDTRDAHGYYAHRLRQINERIDRERLYFRDQLLRSIRNLGERTRGGTYYIEDLSRMSVTDSETGQRESRNESVATDRAFLDRLYGLRLFTNRLTRNISRNTREATGPTGPTSSEQVMRRPRITRRRFGLRQHNDEPWFSVPQVQVNDVPVTDPTSAHRTSRPMPQLSSTSGIFRPRFFSSVNLFDLDVDEYHREQTFETDSNAANHRIQVWNMADGKIPNIANSEKNIVVAECKIQNDASVDISQDGNLLVTLLTSGGSSNSINKLGVFSIQWETLGQCLYTASFEQSAVSVSLSATARYLAVGLATKRVSLVQGSERFVMAQLYKLESDRRTVLVRDIERTPDFGHTSLNCIRWSPVPGQGLVYATNTGQLKVLT